MEKMEEDSDKGATLESYLSIYSSYFQMEKLFTNYHKPKCKSHLCLPRDSPYTYYYSNEQETVSIVLIATNVMYSKGNEVCTWDQLYYELALQ